MAAPLLQLQYTTMKENCSMGFKKFYCNGFVATHALGRMMYDYTLLVSVSHRVLNKSSKERNISNGTNNV